MGLKIKSADACQFDLVALGECMMHWLDWGCGPVGLAG
jgi:hypothetical protein